MSGTADYQAGISSNDVVLSYAQEATWGVKPAVAFKQIRDTGEGLKGSKSRQRPNERRQDRQASAAVTTQESADGNINFALSYATYDDLVAGVMGADWSAALAIDGDDGDISTEAIGNKLTSTTPGKFDDIAPGQCIRLAGFAPGASTNNGFFRVASINEDGDELTLAGRTVTNETPAGTAAKVRGSMIRNGTIFKSFYFQKRFAANMFLVYPGAFVQSANLQAGVGQFMQGGFNLIAKSEEKALVEGSTGAMIAAPDGAVHDTVAGFQALSLDDVTVPAVVESVALTLTNEGAAADYGVGSASAQGMRAGTFTLSGTLRTFFKSFDLYDRFKSEQGGRISYRTVDSNGNAYVLTVLNATLMNPQVVAGGPNQSVMAEFQIEGNPDPVTGRTFQLDRLPVVA